PAGRTRIGCSTPTSRIDAVSDASASSSNAWRGWWRLLVPALTGTSMRFDPACWTAVTSEGIRAPRPLPSPLRRATAHLLGQLAVGDGPPRGRIACRDRLPVRGRLGQPDRPGN